MNDKQVNKLTMLIAVRNFMAAHEADLSLLPSFSMISGELDHVVERLLSIGIQQKSNKTGVAVDKAQIKEELIRQGFDMSKKLAYYAQLAGNITLKNEVNFSKSEFRNATDLELKQNCELIMDRVNSNLEDLSTHNVTEASVALLETQITAFFEVMPKPKNAMKERKLNSDILKTLFEEGDAILKDKIDMMFETVQTSDIEFYNSYRSARKMNKNYSSRQRAVKVTVTDDAGIPLVKATATVEGSDITKKTSDKGNFYINLMPAGIYTFKFSKTGYKPLSKTVIVSEGEAVKVDVVMEGVFEGVGV